MSELVSSQRSCITLIAHQILIIENSLVVSIGGLSLALMGFSRIIIPLYLILKLPCRRKVLKIGENTKEMGKDQKGHKMEGKDSKFAELAELHSPLHRRPDRIRSYLCRRRDRR